MRALSLLHRRSVCSKEASSPFGLHTMDHCREMDSSRPLYAESRHRTPQLSLFWSIRLKGKANTPQADVSRRLLFERVPHGDGLSLVAHHLVPVVQLLPAAPRPKHARPQHVTVTYEVVVKDADLQGDLGQDLGGHVESQSLVPDRVNGSAANGGFLPLHLLSFHHQRHSHEGIWRRKNKTEGSKVEFDRRCF